MRLALHHIFDPRPWVKEAVSYDTDARHGVTIPKPHLEGCLSNIAGLGALHNAQQCSRLCEGQGERLKKHPPLFHRECSFVAVAYHHLVEHPIGKDSELALV